MQIISNRNELIFRKDYNGKPSYSIGLSRKNQDGEISRGYIKAAFRKGTEVNNQTRIKIKDAWLDFYKDNEDKTVPYIFINDFEIVRDSDKENEQVEVSEKDKPFKEFGASITAKTRLEEQLEITDDDLPF